MNTVLVGLNSPLKCVNEVIYIRAISRKPFIILGRDLDIAEDSFTLCLENLACLRHIRASNSFSFLVLRPFSEHFWVC